MLYQHNAPKHPLPTGLILNLPMIWVSTLVIVFNVDPKKVYLKEEFFNITIFPNCETYHFVATKLHANSSYKVCQHLKKSWLLLQSCMKKLQARGQVLRVLKWI